MFIITIFRQNVRNSQYFYSFPDNKHQFINCFVQMIARNSLSKDDDLYYIDDLRREIKHLDD